MQRLFRSALFAALIVFALSSLALAGSPYVSVMRGEPGKTLVKLMTTKGDIVLELYKSKAPVTVTNFLQYVKSGHYDGTIFHRVINGFMIQGGGFDVNMNEKPTGHPIKNEADNGVKNDLYTIAMARTSDPQSASAQFFINVKKNRNLDYWGKSAQGWGYAVFGEVVDGKRVVDEIKGVVTGSSGPYDDVPLKPIIITKAVILSE